MGGSEHHISGNNTAGKISAGKISAVILNRGTPYPRAVLFEELGKLGFESIISLEGSKRRFDLDGLSASFPSVRFILSSGNVSPGEEINMAAQELHTPLFFVIWDDLRILRGSADRIIEKFSAAADKTPRLCTVPVIQDGSFETMPTLIAPLQIRGKVKTCPFVPEQDGQKTLFPFDGIGIYNRETFLRMGGFDRSLGSSLSGFYWQLMDFGFRSWLWGEEINVSMAVRLSYEGSVTPEDNSTDASFRRFYLKNLAPVFRGDHANLPLRRFPGFLIRSRGDILTGWEEFSLARAWVKINQYRYRCDAKSVTELWGNVHEEAAVS
ncbi:MAG: hypothetical protein FWD78_02855 [Treponema sp.]|nr:hypothetical protein [Treponema sp.]